MLKLKILKIFIDSTSCSNQLFEFFLEENHNMNVEIGKHLRTYTFLIITT